MLWIIYVVAGSLSSELWIQWHTHVPLILTVLSCFFPNRECSLWFGLSYITITVLMYVPSSSTLFRTILKKLYCVCQRLFLCLLRWIMWIFSLILPVLFVVLIDLYMLDIPCISGKKIKFATLMIFFICCCKKVCEYFIENFVFMLIRDISLKFILWIPHMRV